MRDGGKIENSRLEREHRVLLNDATGTDQEKLELEASGIYCCKEQTTPSSSARSLSDGAIPEMLEPRALAHPAIKPCCLMDSLYFGMSLPRKAWRGLSEHHRSTGTTLTRTASYNCCSLVE